MCEQAGRETGRQAGAGRNGLVSFRLKVSMGKHPLVSEHGAMCQGVPCPSHTPSHQSLLLTFRGRHRCPLFAGKAEVPHHKAGSSHAPVPVPSLHLDPTLSTTGPKSSLAFQHLGKLHREVWTSPFVLERGWIRWEKRDRRRGSQRTSEISKGWCWGEQLIVPTAAGTLREGRAHSLKAAMLRTQAPRWGLSGVHRGLAG